MSVDRWGYATTLAEGDEANIVVFNPSQKWTVDPGEFMSRSRNTPFAGWELQGRVVHTVFKGEPVVADGEVV